MAADPAIPDPANVAALIPRVRRALEGPAGSNVLTDDQLKETIADAVADVILYTGGVFGHQLVVESRDDTYGAPNDWTIDPPLDESEATVIAAQAALNYYFFALRDLKVSETISDEGQSWSYDLSATLLRDQLALLRDARDKALEIVQASSPALDAFVSFIESRDIITSRIVEPYARSNQPMLPQHAGFAYGLDYDPRFG